MLYLDNCSLSISGSKTPARTEYFFLIRVENIDVICIIGKRIEIANVKDGLLPAAR